MSFEIISLNSSFVVLFLKSLVLHLKISILFISGLSFFLHSGDFVLFSFHLLREKSELLIMTVVLSNVGLAWASEVRSEDWRIYSADNCYFVPQLSSDSIVCIS